MKVLIIVSDSEFLNCLCEIFGNSKTVCGVTNSASGIETFKKSEWDYVIIDSLLNDGITGIGLYHILSKIKKAKFVVFTDKESQKKDDLEILSKPFSLTEMLTLTKEE